MRLLSTLLVPLLLLAGCSVYRPDINQGNYIAKDMVDQLQPGMTKEQVEYLMGPAMVADPFHVNRWDYLYTIDSRIKERDVYKRVTVYFDGNKVSRIEKDLPAGSAPTGISEEQKKAAKTLSGDRPDTQDKDQD